MGFSLLEKYHLPWLGSQVGKTKIWGSHWTSCHLWEGSSAKMNSERRKSQPQGTPLKTEFHGIWVSTLAWAYHTPLFCRVGINVVFSFFFFLYNVFFSMPEELMSLNEGNSGRKGSCFTPEQMRKLRPREIQQSISPESVNGADKIEGMVGTPLLLSWESSTKRPTYLKAAPARRREISSRLYRRHTSGPCISTKGWRHTQVKYARNMQKSARSMRFQDTEWEENCNPSHGCGSSD